MASAGVRRKVDDLGRVVIPASMRRALGIGSGDEVDVTLDGERIVVSLPDDQCVFCGSCAHLEPFRGRAVCFSCTAAIRALGRSAS